MGTMSRQVALPSASPSRFLRWVISLPSVLLFWLITWQERARERHNLASFDDHMLSDIGLSRAEAERESSKPFWRL